MGVFLNFILAPQRIAPARWEETYQEALQIVNGCDLMDRVITQRSGTRFVFARKTAERDLSGRLGFQVCGSMTSGSDMEGFRLFRDLERCSDADQDNGADILFAGRYLEDPDIPNPSYIRELWGNKTQGKPGHIPLLAIACLFADRFPEAVKIGGDITAGQCRAAVRLANRYLDRPIQPPIVCRAEALAARLRDTGIPEGKQVKAFFDLYLGTLTPEVKASLTKVFSSDALYRHFRDRLARCGPDDRVFKTALRDHLLLGLDLSDLFRMLTSDEAGNRLSLERVLGKLFSCKVHVPLEEKNCVDPLRGLDTAVDGDEEDPHEIGAMMGRTFFAMAFGCNHNLPVYVPLDAIREACRPLDADADAMIDRLLAEPVLDERQEKAYGNGKDSLLNQLRSMAKQDMAKRLERQAHDVCEPKDLYLYQPGHTIEPSLAGALLELMRRVQGFDLEEDYQRFLALDRAGREAALISQCVYLLIHEAVWEHIFAHIMDDSYIRRYFSLLNVDCSKCSIHDLMEPLMSSPALIDELWERAAAEPAREQSPEKPLRDDLGGT